MSKPDTRKNRVRAMLWASLVTMTLLGQGCGSSGNTHEDGGISTPDSPIFREGCVGITPPDSAWPAITYPESDVQTDAQDITQTSDAAVSDLDVLPDHSMPDEVIGQDISDGEVVDQYAPRTPEDASSDVATDVGDPGGNEAMDASTDGDGGDTELPNDALLADASDVTAGDVSECQDKPAACLDAPAPAYSLLDFQQKSCGFGAIYGLDLYEKEVTVVVLLAAW
jgi:hypothetical protein